MSKVTTPATELIRVTPAADSPHYNPAVIANVTTTAYPIR